MGKSNLKFIKTSALMEELERRERLESKITFYCVLPCFIAVINAVGIKISYVVQCYCNELCYKILLNIFVVTHYILFLKLTRSVVLDSSLR